MLRFEYRMVGEKYRLHNGDEPILPAIDEIALCIDTETGTLHKHGDPAHVEAWHNKARAAYQQLSPKHAEALVLLRGKLDVNEVNRCINTQGYARRFYDTMNARLAWGASEFPQ